MSDALIRALCRPPGSPVPRLVPGSEDPTADDDLQLALYLCYELHYRGITHVDPDWEWDGGLLTCRRTLEEPFEQALRDATDRDSHRGDVLDALRSLSSSGNDPSLSPFVEIGATIEQFRELCIHRSAWQLKEADPHSWAIMRMTGGPKAALVAVQYDEYGAGEPRDVHSTLFAQTMKSIGLDDSYGAYLDRLPAVTLSTVNLVSTLGLRRSLLPALLGHLALFETTSVEPMSAYSRALTRLGFDSEARRFFDVHVAADTRHGEVAVDTVVGGFVTSEPESVAEILFGARALKHVEARFTDHVLGSWRDGRSSLRDPEAVQTTSSK